MMRPGDCKLTCYAGAMVATCCDKPDLLRARGQPDPQIMPYASGPEDAADAMRCC